MATQANPCLHGPDGNDIVLTLEGEVVACGISDLLTDPLGSLAKEIGAGVDLGSLVEMYPYGQLVPGNQGAKVPFVFVGAYGYYTDTRDRNYVRARELMKNVGRWMQVDPLWPGEMAYTNVGGNPSSLSDPSGLQQINPRVMPDSGADCAEVGWDVLLRCVPVPFTWEAWCYACAKPFDRQTHNEIDYLAGFTEREKNALRHCVGACRVCYHCGCSCALMLDLREVWQWWTGSGGGEEEAGCDVYNNAMGRASGCNRALDRVTCLDACKWLLKNRRLCV